MTLNSFWLGVAESQTATGGLGRVIWKHTGSPAYSFTRSWRSRSGPWRSDHRPCAVRLLLYHHGFPAENAEFVGAWCDLQTGADVHRRPSPSQQGQPPSLRGLLASVR